MSYFLVGLLISEQVLWFCVHFDSIFEPFCVQETLIEGILEDDFNGTDLDAAVSVMSEFRRNGSHPRPVRNLLSVQCSFYDALERDQSLVVSYLNNDNSEVCWLIITQLAAIIECLMGGVSDAIVPL